MKNKKLALILMTAAILGACGNEGAKPADETKEEKPAVEEKTEQNKDESSDADDSIKEVQDSDEDDEKVATDDEKNVREFKRNPIPQTGKTMEEAIEIFHDHFKDDSINIESVKLTFFNEALDYVIEGFKDGEDYELKIADTGEVIEEKTEKDDDKDKEALDLAKIIKAEDAMEKALEGQKEGAWVVEYELETDDGKAVYDIDIEDGEDVKIDAMTGEIIK